MRVLVTGGTSTVGKHLQQVMPQATYISSGDCDLTNYEQTLALFAQVRPDIVIHLAALVGGIQDNIDRPVQYLEQNILINTNTIRATYQIGATKLIALSSTCVFPDSVARYPMTEADVFLGSPTPTNFEYAYSKRCMIAQIEAYNKQYGTQYCYLTPSNLYSELDTHKSKKAHYVAALLDKIVDQDAVGGNTLHLLGTGKPLRQFTYAGDIARMIKLMIDTNTYESFNISNPETYSIHQLAETTLQSIGKENWQIQYSQPKLDGQYRKDVSIQKLLNIFPNFSFTPFAEGVKNSYINKINK